MRSHLRIPGSLCIVWVVTVALALAIPAHAQEPIDLFPDNAELAQGFVRVCAWNLRHINLEEQGRQFLPGQNDPEDFAILTATFAKGLRDLGCDLAAIVEVQPRTAEPDRLLQLRDRLNGPGSGPWRADQTNIEYDNPNDPFGNLQFGLLWNSTKVTIDPTADRLLLDLRQPRDAQGNLTERRTRAPWLVPVRAGAVEFDVIVLHLKSGGEPPQAAEVDALQAFITARQSAAAPRHLIVLGGWNIRPEQASGRARLRKMMAPLDGTNLMCVVTVEDIQPRLDGWDAVSGVAFDSVIARLVPFSHFNAQSVDTLLDHIAISTTLDEVYDHPIRVQRADGTTDLQPGVQIAVPLIPEAQYRNLTDHLPVVLVLLDHGLSAATSVLGRPPHRCGVTEPSQ
jgi:endonuclease/exonuclease/phosphatase family metal-dependent hydrolase